MVEFYKWLFAAAVIAGVLKGVFNIKRGAR